MKRNHLNDFLVEQIKNKDSQIEGLNQLISSLIEKIESLEKNICSYENLVKELRDTINLLNNMGQKAKNLTQRTQKGSIMVKN